jgi:NADH-quinone oxidoreductase subunit L
MTPNATLTLTVMTTFLPLAACGFILVFTRRRGRLSAAVSILSAAFCLISAGWLLAANRHMQQPLHFAGQWAVSGDVNVAFGYLLDPLSLLMLLIVAAISFLVQFYSWGYMAQDPGKGRYYAFLSLFAWAMFNLTLASTLLQLYIFWELVGLSSYLLIGFWFEKFSASQAGKKAFVMTRFGDVAFFFGILLLLINLGQLDIQELNSPATAQRLASWQTTWAALLIFGGIVGKSAQFPLLTWLPDAMEGPTPVSALLHSATMVAAGVYLMARLFAFFSLSPTAMTVCLLTGTLSLLAASSMAMVARDIKQVWAYSTISQLGFMLMALGAGGYSAGVFHLTTHAGFKALLFLCSGVFLHTYHTNDMFAIGRAGGRKLKIPMICMFIAAAALSGLPPLSGFFSKELILARLAEMPNPTWLAAGLLGAFLTAYYAFRLIFVILFPAQGADREPSAHAIAQGHYAAMALPLVVLALVTLGVGWAQDALTHFLAWQGPEHGGAHATWLPYVALNIALVGVFLAWLEFGRKRSAQIGFVERLPAVARFFVKRWYLDDIYRLLLAGVVDKGISRLFALNDRKVIDAALDALGLGIIAGGQGLARMHIGMIQFRLIVVFLVVLLLTLYVTLGG